MTRHNNINHLFSERGPGPTIGAFPLHGTRHSTVRFGTVHFWGVFHCVQYLVLFLVPPQPRFQANLTVTKTWGVNSADHWLAGENRHCLWTCSTRHNRPLDLNLHSQRRIERNGFEWAHLSFNHQKMAVLLSVEEVQTFVSLIAVHSKAVLNCGNANRAEPSHAVPSWVIPCSGKAPHGASTHFQGGLKMT